MVKNLGDETFTRRLEQVNRGSVCQILEGKTVFGHILLTVLGLLLIVLGFWGGLGWPKPYEALVAWCAPIGLVLMLAGIVLLFIPSFFT